MAVSQLNLFYVFLLSKSFQTNIKRSDNPSSLSSHVGHLGPPEKLEFGAAFHSSTLSEQSLRSRGCGFKREQRTLTLERPQV